MHFSARLLFTSLLVVLANITPVNIVCSSSILEQGDEISYLLSESNKKLTISSEIDLNGGTVRVGSGTILLFKKNGIVKNGILDLNNAKIKTKKKDIFDRCIVKSRYLKASWFNNTDYSQLLSYQTTAFTFEVDKDIEINTGCEIVAPVHLVSKNGSTIKESKPLYIKQSAKGTTIKGVTFDGLWKNDICLWITASDIDISKCTFLHHKGENVYVVYLGRMQNAFNENIKIHGCTFDGMESITDGVGKGKGFNAAISSASSYHNIEIYDCTFKNQIGEDDGEGINIAGDILDNTTPWPNKDDENMLRYGVLKAKIHHNKFYDMTVSAIKVFGKDIEIFNNYIYNSTWNTERGGKSLVRVLEAENVSIIGNKFISTIDASCLLVMNSADVLFKKNTFSCRTDGKRGLSTGSAYFKFQNVKDVIVDRTKADIKQGNVTVNTSVFNIMGGDNVTVKNCNVRIDNTDCLYQVLTGKTYGDMCLENCTFKVTSSCAKWIFVNTLQLNDAKIHISDVEVNHPSIVPLGLSAQTLGTLPYEVRNLRVNGRKISNVKEIIE